MTGRAAFEIVKGLKVVSGLVCMEYLNSDTVFRWVELSSAKVLS